MLIKDMADNPQTIGIASKEFLCGCEFEIEDIHGVYVNTHTKYLSAGAFTTEPHWDTDGLGFVADHSLRNNGLEILTPPSTFEKTLEWFDVIHGKERVKYGPQAFTKRTSIHVHVNTLCWDENKAKRFVLLYALFEPYFFSFDPERKNNIHCVPLQYTMLPNYYKTGFTNLVKVWSKYTAFNLLPIKKHGTIEFRHLAGTKDRKKFYDWIAALKRLWDFVDNSKDSWLKNNLSYGVTTRELFIEVFGFPPPVELDFSTSTIDVKLAFI